MSDLNEYVSLPWVYRTAEIMPGGEWRLTVDGLEDFEVSAASEPELFEHYPGMLRSHLNAYLKLGKVIPIPVQALGATQTTYSAAGETTIQRYNWNIMGQALNAA